MDLKEVGRGRGVMDLIAVAQKRDRW